MSQGAQYRVTVEQWVDGLGWQQVTRTTQPNMFLEFINLSGFANLVKKTRGQLRYQLGI